MTSDSQLDRPVTTLSPPSRDAIVHLVREEVRAELFSGPLPHPDTLAGYENILTGAADRIFTRWEMQSEHRQKLEDFTIKADAKRSDAGLRWGVALEISSLGVALLLGITDHQLAAAAIGSAGILGLGGTTVVSGITRSRERQRRVQQLMDRRPSD
ncbi:MAG: DUF2335 domain-containing protein [Chloroflexota bacterium]|nr:DUF2335 domain-containing protein [Chloroflexota bacterium]